MTIEYLPEITSEIKQMIDEEFSSYAREYQIVSNSHSFTLLAKNDAEIVGVLTGNALYNEVHIKDLIVKKAFRHQKIATQLVNEAIEKFQGDYDYITLNTYAFQAPVFYQKCGFELVFIQRNKVNHQLDKYYFIKSLND